jgi:hypothetical protein
MEKKYNSFMAYVNLLWFMFTQKLKKNRMEDLSYLSLAIDGYKMLQPTMP